MHVLKANVHGNPNIGLYCFATNKFCLMGREVPDKIAEEAEKILKVKVHRITMCGTSLVGAFIAGHQDSILVPNIAFEKELLHLKKLKIPYTVLDTDLTALGNNILCSDTASCINPDFTEKERKQIEDALKVNTEKATIADLNTVGSLAALNSNSMVAHPDILKKEKDRLKKLFNLDIKDATINMGNPYIRSGLVCNDHGFMIGSSSSGVEITNIDEYLGFI
jgi:translation initiation factor 6